MRNAIFCLFLILSLHSNSFAGEPDILGMAKTELNLPGALLRSPSVDVLYVSSEKDNKEYMAYLKFPGFQRWSANRGSD